MKFTNPQLQEHFDRVLPFTTYLPEDLRPIGALMDAYGRFRMIEGDQSPTASEALRVLAAPELRPALRRWYRYHTGPMNLTATEFRQVLSQFIGETL